MHPLDELLEFVGGIDSAGEPVSRRGERTIRGDDDDMAINARRRPGHVWTSRSSRTR